MTRLIMAFHFSDFNLRACLLHRNDHALARCHVNHPRSFPQVDVLGTMALLAYDRNKPGVSIEINVTYTAAAEVGTKLRAEGTALKIGRRLGFTEIRLTDERTGRLIAVGRHTKAFP